MMSYVAERPGVGVLLRDWRRRRRMTQLDLAFDAGVSARHLSFIETGRSRPSAEMIKHLAAELDLPLRERNELLLAGGYAPAYGQRSLNAPEMGPVRDAMDSVLAGHEPYPAVVVDRHWGLVAGNRAVGLLTEGVADHLLEPPVNVLRLSLHPDGLAPRITNFGEWRAHILDRLRRQSASGGDPALTALHEELRALPDGVSVEEPDLAAGEIAVPLRLRHNGGELSFVSTITTFGTAVDITVSELSIEAFFPATAGTAEAVRIWARNIPAFPSG